MPIALTVCESTNQSEKPTHFRPSITHLRGWGWTYIPRESDLRRGKLHHTMWLAIKRFHCVYTSDRTPRAKTLQVVTSTLPSALESGVSRTPEWCKNDVKHTPGVASFAARARPGLYLRTQPNAQSGRASKQKKVEHGKTNTGSANHRLYRQKKKTYFTEKSFNNGCPLRPTF